MSPIADRLENAERERSTPPVERQRRQQVEREQDEVREAQPATTPSIAFGSPAEGRDQHAEEADHKRDKRPCDRDPELGAGARKAGLELRHAAEEPEIDPLNLDPFSSRLQRVTELVQQERDEEKKTQPRQRPVFAVGKAGFWNRNTATASDRR